VSSASLDGQAIEVDNGAALVPLRADRALHRVDIVLRAA
jgi:hypothetical protein